MATILWEHEIDKTVDWGGDISTGGAPVSGKYVQKFIKDTLNKKFGYLYYDRTALKYLVFADEDDYLEYSEDPVGNSALLLASFDAPAPATISIISKSLDNITTLLSATGRKIEFNYYILDKSENPVSENVSFRAVINHAGEQSVVTDTIKSDTTIQTIDGEKIANYANKNVGTKYVFNLDKYLTEEGTYTITITLTGLNTQASTTLTFIYTVVELSLSLPNFEYYKAFTTDVDSYEIPFVATGAAGINKSIEIYIDGELLYQRGIRNAISSGDSIGTAGTIPDSITLYNKNDNGEIITWGDDIETSSLWNKAIFKEGKHTLQLRISIPGDETAFYSNTEYFEFVVVDPQSILGKTYLLYATETPAGTVFNADETITISGQQYTGISLSIAVIDTKDRNVPVNYNIVGRNSEYNATTSKSIQSGTIDNFNYTFNTADTYDLTISVNTNAFTTAYSDEINAVINIEPFALENEVIEESLQRRLMVKYSALNRGNNETNYDEWVNTAPINNNLKYPAVFHNILWTANSGWDGEALILKNGATVELPIDLFNTFFGTYGLTFEIDFETFNVQDDSAIIMDYSDAAVTNTSYLRITATEAALNTKNNIFLKTNFKDGTRNKIAFSFNPTAQVEDGVSLGTGNPNLVMIYVNGVLDRAAKWGTGVPNSDTVEWTQPTTTSLVIGNPDGAAAVKLYSIRIYNSALEPEEAFMNYVVDQGSRIPDIITKNHIYDATGEVSLDLVKANIPTLVLSTDYTKLNNQTNKKNNTMYDLQFFDPTNPELNFYVRNGWISCQGTSSMQYPTKNLRPYFNKQANDKTFPFDLSLTDPVAQQLSNEGIDTSAVFNTEFWPVSEYAGNEDSVATYVDTAGIAPYSVNKKEIVKDKYFSNAYHEIGKGLSNSYKISVASAYIENGIEVYYQNGTRTVTSGESSTTYDKYDIIISDENASAITKVANIVEAGNSIYISAYRPLLRTGWEIGSDEYWKYIKQLRFSGVTVYTKEAVVENNIIIGYNFSKAKKLNKNTEYYGLGCYWRQYDETQRYSGWTDKLTLKADYAESSMTHNGGVGALWGNAMRNFKINGEALGMTKAQSASKDPYYIDIRTSCDSKPVVLFVKEPESYNTETGKVNYSSPRFAGLFNIMTDKSSTPLFGFEDIKDETNTTIFDASDVECWEFLQNGSLIATGVSTRFDTNDPVTYDDEGELLTGEITFDIATSDKNGLNIGEGRPIYTDFEPRWPESGEAKHEKDPNFYQDDVFGVESNKFESFWNWVHFTKPAINYTISGIDGYDFSPYVAFKNTAEAVAFRGTTSSTPVEGKEVYLQWNNSGNIAYAKEGTEYRDSSGNTTVFTFNANQEGLPLYWLNESINYEDVSKSINTQRIGDVWGSEVYKVAIEGFDAINRCNETDADGNVTHDETKAANYLVDVYMKRQGTQYSYEDEYGNWTVYNRSSEINSEDFESVNGVPYSQRTFMQYFEDTMEQHLDLYKVAAYYVYIMRFGAVDQVVKNSMMTTEDGEHWYFINYDNDTVLGVRNDALLIFNWDFDRDTYDYSGNNYAYAGAKSVLWNNLSMSSRFMDIVKAVDNALYSSGLLSSTAVLEYLNEKMCGTWNERLYNAQEQIKYLSTFKNNFTTDKFLQFMQGTRQSHRIWWVNHRWELFDAMWGTGSYSTKRIRFYEVINEATASNPIDFLTITSGSKYYYTVQKNNNTITDGFVELAANDSKTFTTRTNIAIGDPMVFVGPQKVKVLNFRPGVKYLSATLSLNESYKIAGQEGSTTWVKEAGTMMSKLLIGDGNSDSPLTNISGLNDITSLEEVDIRRCKLLTSTPAVSSLNNLHRFRATDSAISLFEPAQGATLYEVSLPSVNASARNEVIVTDENGNPVQAQNADGTPMTDAEGNPIYETRTVSSVYALQTLTLNNVTFMHQNASDYVVYQDNNADALPYTEDAEGNLSGIYTNEKAYKYTSESKAIFDVQPTTRLSKVVFNNVVGLDTKAFVMDWKNIILSNTESLSSRSLTLRNINWNDITVSELIEFLCGKDINDNTVATFSFAEEVTGLINVKSDTIDPETNENAESITLEEYNRIIKYFGEDVFVSGNALQITTGENIFYQPTSDTKVSIATFESNSTYDTITKQANVSAYEFIRGNEFKVKATIFPDNGYEKVYVLNGWNANGSDRTISHSSTVYTDNGTRVQLVTNADGTATLTAEDSTVYNNCLYSITVCDVINGEVQYNSSDRYIAEKNIYVIPTNRVIPIARDVEIYTDGNKSYNITVNDENKHTVRFDLGTTTNAPVESVDINIPLQYIDYIKVDNKNYRIEDNQLYVDFNVLIPEYNITDAEVVFTINFEANRSNAYIDKSIFVSIIPIQATHIELYDKNNNSLENGSIYNINRTGEYEFTVKILSDREDGYYNVPIVDSDFAINTHIGSWNNTVEISELDENNKFTVKVTQGNQYRSFTRADYILIRLYNKFDTNKIYPIEFSIDIYESIVYPDNTYIAIQNYEGDYEEYINTGSSDNEANIYLLNNQGTTTSSPVKLIEGQDHIKVKVLAKDVLMLDSRTEQQIAVQPTEAYNINMEVTSIVSENGIDIDNVTATVVEGEHGNDTIELKVPALTMISDTLTIKGSYSLSYDRDGNVETTEDAVNNTYPFTINVYHLVASAKTYTNLTPGKLYLVDENSNYYDVDDLDTDDLTALNNITNAAAGVNFTALGFTVQQGTSTIIPYFALLRDKSLLNFKTIRDFLPRDRGTLNDGGSANTFNWAMQLYYVNENNVRVYQFVGNYNTEYWVNEMLGDSSTWSGSKLSTIYNLYDRKGTIKTYIPTYNEISALFGNTTTFAHNYDRIVIYLNDRLSKNYLTLEDSMATFSDITSGQTYSELPSDRPFYWIVTSSSTQYVGSDAITVWAGVPGVDEQSNNLTVTNTSNNIYWSPEYADRATILPFVKVS